jgi:hypothetical protein
VLVRRVLTFRLGFPDRACHVWIGQQGRLLAIFAFSISATRACRLGYTGATVPTSLSIWVLTASPTRQYSCKAERLEYLKKTSVKGEGTMAKSNGMRAAISVVLLLSSSMASFAADTPSRNKAVKGNYWDDKCGVDRPACYRERGCKPFGGAVSCPVYCVPTGKFIGNCTLDFSCPLRTC